VATDAGDPSPAVQGQAHLQLPLRCLDVPPLPLVGLAAVLQCVEVGGGQVAAQAEPLGRQAQAQRLAPRWLSAVGHFAVTVGAGGLAQLALVVELQMNVVPLIVFLVVATEAEPLQSGVGAAA